MRVAIVDDEPLARDYLKRILSKFSYVELVACYNNGRQAIAGLQADPVDVAFLDIQMPGLTGIDVIKSLQSDTMPLMVFATAYSEFAVEAFELHAVDYILKPFLMNVWVKRLAVAKRGSSRAVVWMRKNIQGLAPVEKPRH